MGEHAQLSPSSAKRWLTCPASAAAAASHVSPDTVHSLAGTAGHYVFAEWLQHGAPPVAGTKAPNGIEITPEMLELVREPVEWVQRYRAGCSKASVLCEEKIQIGAIFGLTPEILWGTTDLLVLAPHELLVFDLKLGHVDVPAENNDQLLLYAIGACEELGWLWDIIRMVIHQPRSGGVKEWVVAREDLLAKMEELKPKVIAATLPDAPFVPTEEGCRFCPAAGVCKALQAEALALARQEFDTPAAIVENITPQDLALLLQRAPVIEAALKAAKEHALKLIQLGQEVPGFKVVEGRKNRVWIKGTEDRMVESLTMLGFDADNFAPRKLVSPAQAEELVGKNVVAEFITTPKGEPVLAPMSDKRPALAGDFNVVDTGMMLE